MNPYSPEPKHIQHLGMARLRRYLQIVASLLFIQGATVLLCLAFSISLPSPWNRAIRPDGWHGLIHVVWAGGIWLALWRGQLLRIGRLRIGGLLQIAWSFSLFYLLFALGGWLMVHPLGLLLDTGENLFHLLVGAIALVLALNAGQSRRNSGL